MRARLAEEKAPPTVAQCARHSITITLADVLKLTLLVGQTRDNPLSPRLQLVGLRPQGLFDALDANLVDLRVGQLRAFALALLAEDLADFELDVRSPREGA